MIKASSGESVEDASVVSDSDEKMNVEETSSAEISVMDGTDSFGEW